MFHPVLSWVLAQGWKGPSWELTLHTKVCQWLLLTRYLVSMAAAHVFFSMSVGATCDMFFSFCEIILTSMTNSMNGNRKFLDMGHGVILVWQFNILNFSVYASVHIVWINLQALLQFTNNIPPL